MDIARFDTRRYETVSAADGYGEWARTYEDTVLDLMDLRLFEQLRTVPWNQARHAADLACGTGRIGVWLARQGVDAIDGVDLTPEMLELAHSKGIYRRLQQSDVGDTPLASNAYDVVTASLVDEHLPDLRPLYSEAARIACPGGYFVLVGYHPWFMINGTPTHYDRATGEPVSIRCYVHLFSDHVQAALAAGWTLREMHEGVIDDDWVALKPKWSRFLDHPISFAFVWQKGDG
jgi:SAM-dependent methyltransferase